MNIALYGKTLNDNVVPNVRTIFQKLEKLGVTLVVEEKYNKLVSSKIKLDKPHKTFSTHQDLKNIDVLISIGGDGSLLDTLMYVRNSGIPILGINTGRLGFLASVSKEDIEQALEMLVQKKYVLDKRSLLRLESKNNLFGEVNYALNEVTIHKKDTVSMITIHAYIDGEFLNSYWADGLIISTPTGSTAYSLSCGGPIIAPESESLVITPMSPHNLNVRPIVIPDKSVLKLKIEGRSKDYLVSLDSRSEIVDESFELTIRKEDFSINLIKLEMQNFLSTIRNKLLWGLDKRN